MEKKNIKSYFKEKLYMTKTTLQILAKTNQQLPDQLPAPGIRRKKISTRVVIQGDALTVDFHNESSGRKFSFQSQAIDFEATVVGPIHVA